MLYRQIRKEAEKERMIEKRLVEKTKRINKSNERQIDTRTTLQMQLVILPSHQYCDNLLHAPTTAAAYCPSCSVRSSLQPGL